MTLIENRHVGIYCRVSSDEQAQRDTVEVQRRACREYAERSGWVVVEEFVDNGVSGAKAFEERPAGAALMAALKGKRIERVVIYCVDRLSRDNLTGVPAYNKLNRLTGGRTYFVLQAFDDTAEGELQFNIFMTIASYERKVIRRWTMTGLQKRIKDKEIGYRASTSPFGHRYNADTKQLEVREDTAATVRRIFEESIGGMGTNRIAIMLNDEKVPSPAPDAITPSPTTPAKGK